MITQWVMNMHYDSQWDFGNFEASADFLNAKI